MKASTRALLGGAFAALNAANAKKSFARSGPVSLPAFSLGWPTSELPMQAAAVGAAYQLKQALGGSLKTTGGKAGVALTIGAAAILRQVQQVAAESHVVLEAAMVDELGANYRERIRHAPAYPTAPLTKRAGVFRTIRGARGYMAHRGLAYGDKGYRNELDIWKRADLPVDGKAPVLLHIHGGGWAIGQKDQQAFPLMSRMTAHGWICVTANYRLSPRSAWPAHILDVKAALAWTREHIAEYGGDPDFIAITGGSAGGHLSSLAALTPNKADWQPGFEHVDTSVQAAVPIYGMYDWTNRDGTSRADVSDFLSRIIVKQPYDAEHMHVYDEASPMSHVGPHAPPLFTVHGTNDSLIPFEQARSFTDMLAKVSPNPVVYAELPQAQHAFEVFDSVRAHHTVETVERFLGVVYGDWLAEQGR